MSMKHQVEEFTPILSTMCLEHLEVLDFVVKQSLCKCLKSAEPVFEPMTDMHHVCYVVSLLCGEAWNCHPIQSMVE